MADPRRRAPDVLDGTASERSSIIDVESTPSPAVVAPSTRGALTTFIAKRFSFVNVEEEGTPTRPFPLAAVTFTAFVIVPAILVILYFAFIASNQYVAEMRLVVRMGRSNAMGSALSGLVGQIPGAGSMGGTTSSGSNAMPMPEGGTSNENAHIVTSYIHSRAVVDELMKRVDLREIFRRPEADFYARLTSSASIEDLTKFWQNMVRTSLDSMSGIVTVNVRAFRPDDAVTLSKHIEDLSEKLVNTISERARADTLRRATEEVQRAQRMLLASLQEMEKYRNREGLIDPIEAAKQQLGLLTKVLGDQLELESQLFVATKSLSPESATVRSLQTRAETVRRQVAELRAKLASDDAQSASVAGALARYEEVAVQQRLAQTLYTMAENGLERARIAAEAQSVYLTVFVKPGVPEDTVYPKRVQFSLLWMVSFLVAWSICALIWASIQDHRMN